MIGQKSQLKLAIGTIDFKAGEVVWVASCRGVGYIMAEVMRVIDTGGKGASGIMYEIRPTGDGKRYIASPDRLHKNLPVS